MNWLFEGFRMISWAVGSILLGLVIVTIWERVVAWLWREK